MTAMPEEIPKIRAVPMPSDLNMNGNIFGGWVLSQMDIAGGIAASSVARGRVATVAVEAMKFHAPINVGDVVSVYADVEKTGRTSLHVRLNVFACNRYSENTRQVTEGLFVFVAVDDDGEPRAFND